MTDQREMDVRGSWVFEDNNWVVQSNKLIEAQMESSLLEKKIFLAVVMQIQPTDEKLKKYSVGIKQIAEELRIKESDLYREIYKATTNLLARNVTIERADDSGDKKSKKDFTMVSLMTYADYTNGVLSLKVNEDMKPYLLNLNQNFTKYQIKNILELRSVYSIRLYELMRQRLGLNGRTIYLADLKRMLGVGDDEYSRFIDFERFVLKKSIAEINEKTDIRVDYEKIKVGRSVDQIDFFIESQSVDDVDAELKQYFGDTYQIEKMKVEMGISNLKLDSKQIIELYSRAVDKLNGMGRIKMSEGRIYEYVRINLQYTEDRSPDVSFYGYLLKAVTEDLGKAVLTFFAQDMGVEHLLTAQAPVEEDIDEEAERQAGYNFNWD